MTLSGTYRSRHWLLHVCIW